MRKTMKKCPNCETSYSYNEKHDAYYCEKCNFWSEKNCGDKNCYFCADRPEKPIKEKND